MTGDRPKPGLARAGGGAVGGTNREHGATRLRRLKPYAAYKNSAVQWLGEIPTSWEALKLKRICSFAYGDALPSEDRVDGDVEVFGSNGPVGTHERANTLSPCLVIGRKGSFGKINYSPSPVFAIDTTFFLDRHVARADIRWLYYVLTDARLDSASKDSAVPGLDREDAYARHIAACSMGEQRAIAAFLDGETARIDRLIAKKERLIGLLQEQHTALITRAITKGLDPKITSKRSDTWWLGEIPEHWDVKRLWHLTPSGRRIMYGIVLPGPSVEEGVPIVKGGDVSAERLRLDQLNRTTFEIEAGYVRSRLRGGDLVIAIRGSIGEVAIVPDELEGANLTQDAARVSYTRATHGRWLLYALKSAAVFAQLEAGALGATIRGINIRDLKRASIPVPPREEQERIAKFLDWETGRIDALVAKVREAIDRLREFRIALISAAVTGKIDVREEVA
jgi:type I restriction enzyme S subunit